MGLSFRWDYSSKKMSEKIALFFCSASFGIDPKYNQAAREFVRAACLRAYVISSGGTIKSTMKVVVDEAKSCGARTLGVIPRFMAQYVHPDLDEVVWTESMSERKEKMREGTSLAVLLPGGIGSMDEFFETFTLAKLGRYSGKLIVVNVDGYYDKLKDLLDHFTEMGMLDSASASLVHFADTVEQFEQLI